MGGGWVGGFCIIGILRCLECCCLGTLFAFENKRSSALLENVFAFHLLEQKHRGPCCQFTSRLSHICTVSTLQVCALFY